MSKLGRVVEAVENYNQFVLDEVKRARARTRSSDASCSIAGTKSKQKHRYGANRTCSCRALPCRKSTSRARLPVTC